MFKRIAGFLICTMLFVGLAAHAAFAVPTVWPVNQITSGTAQSTHPLISGDRIVWWDDQGGTRVLTWKSGETTALAIVNAAVPPGIDVDRIAWFNFRTVDVVQTWTPASGITTITSADNSNFGAPQVSGDRVVWADTDLDVVDSIYTWKPGDVAPSKLSTGALRKGDPVVSGDRVAWYESDGSANQVFTRVVGDAGPQQITHMTQFANVTPKISGDRLVWSEPIGDSSVYLFTWTPGSGVTTVGPNPGAYAISGDRIAFEEWVEGSDGMVTEIMTWTPASGVTTVTTGDDNHMRPDVSGDRLVWLDDRAVMTWKVGDSSPTSLTTGVLQHDNPHVSGDRVVWEGADAAGVHQIYTAVPTPLFSTALKALGKSRVRVKKTYTLSGSIAPATASGRVSIVFKRYYRRAWHTVGTTKRATLAGGKYVYRYKPATRGSWRAYVSYAGTTTSAAVYRAARTVSKSFKVY
jgi:hypothetical protein